MKVIYVIVLILALIGALNLWAIGFFDFNAITRLATVVFPAITNAETAEVVANPLTAKAATIAYDVIGVSAILTIICSFCKKNK